MMLLLMFQSVLPSCQLVLAARDDVTSDVSDCLAQLSIGPGCQG